MKEAKEMKEVEEVKEDRHTQDRVSLRHWEARVIRGDVRGKTERLRFLGPVNGAGPQDDRFFVFRDAVRQGPMREASHANTV